MPPTPRFGGKGVKDSDPMSIGVFIFLIFLMYKWLTTASITPYQLPTSPNNIVSSMFTSFNFLLIILIPLTILLILQAFRAEVEGTKREFTEFQGRAERFFHGSTSGFVTRTNAARQAKREKRSTYKQVRTYKDESDNAT